MIQRLFLHFFDLHFLDEKGVNREPSKIRRFIQEEARLATRFAILGAEQVFVPAASFVESDLCFKVLRELEDLYELGSIQLIGGGTSLRSFAEEKLQQYDPRSLQSIKYAALKRDVDPHPPFQSRKFSASEDIAKGWVSALTDGRMERLVKGSTERLSVKFERNWERVNDRLGGRAFVLDYVEPLLSRDGLSPVIKSRLHGIINGEYIESFTRELCAGVVCELNYLGASYSVPSYGVDLSYRDILKTARTLNLLDSIRNADAVQLANLRTDPKWLQCLSMATQDYQQRMNTLAYRLSVRTTVELAEVTVGIITALPEEFAAACEVFSCDPPVDMPGRGAGRKYSLAKVESSSRGSHRVAVTMLTDMGNNSAAIRATQMISHCPNVEHIIMCGIAGAVPNPKKPFDHVRLGDIVVSDRNGIIQYDFVKELPFEVVNRHPPRPPAASLMEAVRYLRAEELKGNFRWERYLNKATRRLGAGWQRPGEDEDRLRDGDKGSAAEVLHPRDPARVLGRPRVFHGPIASANRLLKNPVVRDALRDAYGVKAVEMEGSGIADATWNLERGGYLVVRGTCDYCDPDKGDTWHQHAAVAAASYARAVVEMLAVS